MKKADKVQRTVLTAVLAALTCAATMLHVPTVNGYANLGDCMVITCAWVLGPLYGACAAALGSALADIILYYALYAPATFVIKGLMALTAYFLCAALSKTKVKAPISRVTGAISAETVMVLGYFVFETLLYGNGAGLASLISNIAQGVVGAIGGTLVYGILVSTHTVGTKKL